MPVGKQRRPANLGIVTVLGLVLVAGTTTAANGPQPMSPQAFVNAAAQSDAYEIAAGQLILTQSQDPRVRAFAQAMLAEHQKTSADLRAAAQASHLEPPGMTLGGDQQRMLGALQSQKGADLDRSFMLQQVNAHAAELVTERGYLAQGTDPNLRRAAQGAVPLIEHHLEMAKQTAADMAAS
jgi:putative membrane protein